MTQSDQQPTPATGIEKTTAQLDQRIEEFNRRFDERLAQMAARPLIDEGYFTFTSSMRTASFAASCAVGPSAS
jgi:hypothetical protein